MSTIKPAIEFWIDGPPKTKENKGAFSRSGWFTKKHEDIVNWEVYVNHMAIRHMRDAGWPGPYTGRCKIVAGQTFESWKKCDITNYWKSLNDALEGACWVNDWQVDDARAVRFIDRGDPGIYVMVWFFDMDFMEEYWTGKITTKFHKKTGQKITTPVMKYPDTYAIFDLDNYDYKTTVGYVSKPENCKATRFGEYVPQPTLEERKAERKRAKGTEKKPNKARKKKAVSNEQAKAAGTTSGKRSSSNGSKGAVRRRTSS